MRLHGEYMTEGRAHAGIIFGDQQRLDAATEFARLVEFEV